MDLKDFIENGLGTLQYGYFAAKSVPKWTLRDDTDWAGWETLMHSVERLKGGDFEALDDAWDVYLRTPDPLVQDACQILFGNAGTFSLYQKMRAELERSREEDPPLHYLGKSIDFCNAFTRWGRLDVVPVLLDTYLSLILKGIRHDIDIIPVLIDEFFTDETEDTLISHGTTEDMIDLSLIHI